MPLTIARVFNGFDTTTRETRLSSSRTIACVLHVASIATAAVGERLSAKTRSSSGSFCRTPSRNQPRTRNWTTALLAFKIHFGDRVPDTAK
jgi:hypothetical protein